MTITINGTTGITNDGGYTGDGVVFADTTPANTLVTTTGGNVGIGTSSPSAPLTVRKDQAAATYVMADNVGTVGASTSAGFACAEGGAVQGFFRSMRDGSGQVQLYNAGAYPLVFGTNNTERARIDSSGNLLVGTASGAFSGRVVALQTTSASDVFTAWNSATSGNNSLIGFFTDGGTGRGSITYNRGAGLVAYNTTSDYRAKDIHSPVLNALETVAQLKPYMGTMKGATVERPMFIAHEAQQVAAYAVVGDKDAVNDKGEPVYQQMDHSTLVPLLTAAIQEQQAIILAQESALNALTARVAALEGTTNV